MSDRKIDRVLDALYLASADPSAWLEFLSATAALFDAVVAGLIFAPAMGGPYAISSVFGLSDEARRLYNDRYAAIDPWYLGMRDRGIANHIGPGSALCAHARFEKTEFYQDYWKAQVGTWFQGGIIHLDARMSSVLTLHRGSGRGDFDEGDTQLLKSLFPHLMRAFAIHRKMLDLNDSVASAGGVVAALDVGLIGLSAGRKVRFTNGIADALLQRGELLMAPQGILTTIDPQANQVLAHLVDGAGRRGLTALPGGSFTLSRKGKTLHICAIPTSPPPGLMPDCIRVFLTITDPHSVPVTREKLLAELFHLTPAEIRVVMMLLEGLDAPEIAARNQTTKDTVRFQLKTIYRKTGTGRQIQLVRLISKLPGWPGAK